MDVVSFIKTYQRMCRHYDAGNCENENGEYCPLKSFVCKLSEASAEEIGTIAHKVEDWGKVHPARTKASDLKKVFPEVEVFNDGTPNVCPEPFRCDTYCDGNSCQQCKKRFWNTEIEED